MAFKKSTLVYFLKTPSASWYKHFILSMKIHVIQLIFSSTNNYVSDVEVRSIKAKLFQSPPTHYFVRVRCAVPFSRQNSIFNNDRVEMLSLLYFFHPSFSAAMWDFYSADSRCGLSQLTIGVSFTEIVASLNCEFFATFLFSPGMILLLQWRLRFLHATVKFEN